LVYPDDGYAPIAIESPNEYVANIYRQFWRRLMSALFSKQQSLSYRMTLRKPMTCCRHQSPNVPIVLSNLTGLSFQQFQSNIHPVTSFFHCVPHWIPHLSEPQPILLSSPQNVRCPQLPFPIMTMSLYLSAVVINVSDILYYFYLYEPFDGWPPYCHVHHAYNITYMTEYL
jgi:hypothetical protein